MKKLTALWLALLFALAPLAGCTQDAGIVGSADGPTEIIISDGEGEPESESLGPAVTDMQAVPSIDAAPDEDGWYDSRDDVARYLMEYGTLPQNYITKAEARALGWEGGSLEAYMPGASIGGDIFGNYEGSLPEKEGRTYTECDINTAGADERGSERIVFSNDGLIFYTADHYETFTLLLGDGQDEGTAP